MGTYDTVGGTPASPDEPCYAPSRLVEGVLLLLEEAGVPEGLSDMIADLIEGWEAERDTALTDAETAEWIANASGEKR